MLRLVIIFLGCVLAPLRADLPDWLQDSTRLPLPAVDPAAPAVVILNETLLEMDEQGIMTETHRIALKVLNSSGRKYALGLAYYNGASAKLVDARAWVVRNGTALETKGRAEWVDATSRSPGAAIDESRVSSIDLSERAVSGDYFGFETRVRTPLVVAQLYWSFGHRLPQVAEKVSLILPPGFTASHLYYGAMEPALNRAAANRWNWSLADQPLVPEEPRAPESAWINAEMLVRIQAPPGAAKFALSDFAAWTDVTALYDRLNAGQCDAAPALVAKAKELAAGETDPLRIISRIAGFVQDIRYVGINQGLKYGYGWRSRKASEVFATGYGDCKDKANLMMAMLRECGIRCHRVIARLDRDRIVRSEFPSPIQFNHAIVAIEVPATVDLPTVVEVPGAGRLLFFDPTDPHTGLGGLSLPLQGGYVHLAVPGADQLVQLPVIPAEDSFRTERHLKILLAGDGSLGASVTITGAGQAAAAMRRDFRETTTATELLKLAASHLGGTLKAAQISQVETTDGREQGRSELTFTVAMPAYLQQNSAVTAVLKLDVLNKRALPNLPAPQRRTPVQVDPAAIVDEIVVELPPGYVVGEMPRSAEINSPFGRFQIEFTQADGRLRMKRQLTLHRRTVEPADYAPLRQFLSQVSRADRTAVLLQRAP